MSVKSKRQWMTVGSDLCNDLLAVDTGRVRYPHATPPLPSVILKA